MSFFGLTALGPQNDFQSHSVQVTHLMVFEDQDYDQVWRQFSQDGSYTLCKNLPEMMEKLYHGPVPRNDLIKIEIAFSKYTDKETITYYEFLNTMQDLRKEAEDFEEDPPTNSDFNSVTELHAAMRGMKMPKDSFFRTKQVAPLTATQEFGWNQPKEYSRPEFYRHGSDLTKFAAELIKNGVY